MPQILPLVPSIPNYRVGTTLDGEPFVFDVRWNARDGAWYLDVLEIDETPIRHGIKVVLGVLLGWRSVNPEFPAGQLIAVDLTSSGTEAGLDDLGDRVQVFYYAPGEL